VSSHKNILTFVFVWEKVTEIVNMFEITVRPDILAVKKKRKENFGCKKNRIESVWGAKEPSDSSEMHL
jgi:hypothetical protein